MKRQLLAFSLVAASTLATVGIVTSAAQAGRSPLKISALHCDGTGGGNYLCSAKTSGGRIRYRYAWNPGKNATVVKKTDNFNVSHIKGKCKIGTKPVIRVMVKNYYSRPTTATRSTSFKCDSVAL
ncbi:MAG: hypothetical protein AAF378_11805 [Cyanobacteria bacterium P01_A01_bin.84]